MNQHLFRSIVKNQPPPYPNRSQRSLYRHYTSSCEMGTSGIGGIADLHYCLLTNLFHFTSPLSSRSDLPLARLCRLLPKGRKNATTVNLQPRPSACGWRFFYPKSLEDSERLLTFAGDKGNTYCNMDTITVQTVPPVISESRYSRLLNAREYAKQQGWEPLKPEEREEFLKMVAEFTNL